VHREALTSVGGAKAMPAVRALARKLGVDLSRVRASGDGGVVTAADVKAAAADGSAVAGAARPAAAAAPAPSQAAPAADAQRARTTDPSAGKPMRTAPPGEQPRMGQPEPLRGVRRNMARIMADAHAQVVPTMICDDADLHAWQGKQDVTARLIRAI